MEPPAAAGEITVTSNYVLGEIRRGMQTAYFAQQVHRLRPVDGGFRMAYKKVMLINNNEPIHNLSFIV
jgi:3-phenylpropionate/cinnamic acid dioxygenase small subunit